jgi:hypothetical protein
MAKYLELGAAGFEPMKSWFATVGSATTIAPDSKKYTQLFQVIWDRDTSARGVVEEYLLENPDVRDFLEQDFFWQGRYSKYQSKAAFLRTVAF